MPVNVLLVEGKLDLEILHGLLGGVPLVQRGGSKNSLAPQARTKRKETAQTICYLRDRDFDHDPPSDVSCPAVDRRDDDTDLGWRWCRHEIENYLLDPTIVLAATGWPEGEYAGALVSAAKRIRHYEIARWVVGTCRRCLPPHYDLRTKPEELEGCDFRLPALLAEKDVADWARGQIRGFFEHVKDALDSNVVESELKKRSEVITESFLDDVNNVLLWCSGKDILAALGPWLQERGQHDAGGFRGRMRDWVRNHPQMALELLPEWNALVKLVTR